MRNTYKKGGVAYLAYEAGYDDGLTEGYEKGHSEGYVQGFCDAVKRMKKSIERMETYGGNKTGHAAGVPGPDEEIQERVQP